MEHFSALPQTEINSSTEPCLQHAVFLFFSDDSKKYASTTTAHRNRLIELLKTKKTDVIIEYNMGKYWWLCRAIYMCLRTIPHVSLSQRHWIIIDWGISAPGHDKEVVDGPNYIDKGYMYQLMSTVKLPGLKISEKQILMHSCTQKKYVSLAK